MIGEHLGRYLVLETIGSGGMGVVVRALDPELEREVAIKLVRPRVLSPERSEAARARLLSEARALARISHPNVVAVYEVGVHEGLVFVAMELIDGVDLGRWLELRPRTVREIVAAYAAAARGLAQVHAAGLVHRDVKPANILVGADGRVRIGDFGIAHASFELPVPPVEGCDVLDHSFDLDTTALTAEGRVVGTPAYMAPEQHLGLEVGPAADQYALCVALYEALWGRRPFRVDARRLLAAKLGGPGPLPTHRDVPRWLAAIVLRGLAPDPAQRFASMDALGDALAADPSRARRRVVGLAAGALTIAALALVVSLDARAAPCESDATALAGVWDASTRATVERVFASSERPWAAPAWEHLQARLDRYAADWTAMRRDACEATQLRGEQSEALLDRRMGCLDARRRELAAATELLAIGDDSAIDHSFDLLGRLRPIASCGDAAALTAAVPPPDDPELVAPVAAVRTDLARARAIADAGRHGDALELARTAVAAAHELDHPPLLAEALAFEGEALLRVGPVSEARTVLESALWTAIAVGHDQAAADAATNLVWVSGQYERSLPDALRWAERARASLRRSDHESPVALALLDNALGAAQQHAAHYDEALAFFESALARIADDPDALGRAANIRHNIAKSWFDRGDLDRARATLEPAIAELAPIVGDDHPRVVAMRGTLAQVFGAAGDHERAIELFTAEVEGLRLAMGDDALAVAHARTNLGVELGRMGRTDEAIAITEQALASFERAGDDGGAATCLGNLAKDLLAKGIHDAAASRFERALELLERMHPDGHPDQLYPLVGLGRVRFAQGRHDDALANFERADLLLTRMHGSSGHARGLALEGKGQALVALGRTREALVVLGELIELMRAAADVGVDELPLALRQRADAHNRLGNFAAARVDAEEAVELARGAGLDDLRVGCEAELERARAGLASGG